MTNDTIVNILLGAFLVGILILIYLAYHRRRLRAQRIIMMQLLERYFQGDMPPEQLGQRTRAIVGRHFIHSAESYSLAVAAFQRGVDAKRERQTYSKEDERKFLWLLAALKKEFGLTELYQSEAWRPGRE